MLCCQMASSQLRCSHCLAWFHGHCVKLKSSMTKLIDKKGLEWICRDCHLSNSPSTSSVSLIQSENMAISTNSPLLGQKSTSFTPKNSPRIGNWSIASSSGSLKSLDENTSKKSPFLGHSSSSITPINSPIIGNRCIASSSGSLNPSQEKRKNELISTNSPLLGRKSPSISLNNSPIIGN